MNDVPVPYSMNFSDGDTLSHRMILRSIANIIGGLACTESVQDLINCMVIRALATVAGVGKLSSRCERRSPQNATQVDVIIYSNFILAFLARARSVSHIN